MKSLQLNWELVRLPAANRGTNCLSIEVREAIEVDGIVAVQHRR